MCPDENSSKPEAEPATNLESKAETIAAGGKEAIDFEAARAQTAFEASIDVPPPVVVDPQLAYIVVYQRRGMIPSLSLPPVDKVEVTAARPPTPVWVPGPSTGVPPPPPGPPPGGGQAPSAGRPPTPCAKLSKVSHIPPLELSGTASQPASEGFRPIDEPSKITRSAKTKASGHQVSFREDLPEQSEYGRGGGGKRKKYCHDATSVMGRVDEVHVASLFSKSARRSRARFTQWFFLCETGFVGADIKAAAKCNTGLHSTVLCNHKCIRHRGITILGLVRAGSMLVTARSWNSFANCLRKFDFHCLRLLVGRIFTGATEIWSKRSICSSECDANHRSNYTQQINYYQKRKTAREGW